MSFADFFTAIINQLENEKSFRKQITMYCSLRRNFYISMSFRYS